jgi:Cu/Ag efflux protein CusF
VERAPAHRLPGDGAVVIAAAAFVSAIHGTVVAVDRTRGLVSVHHRAHAGMMMDMTMVVRMRDRRELTLLKKGDHVELRCDERVNPWVCVRT